MIRTLGALLLAVVPILSLLDCSGRSSTSSEIIAPLPAFDLSADPVLEISDYFLGEHLNDGVLKFDFQGTLDTSDSNARYDLMLEYYSEDDFCSPDLHIWDPNRLEWSLWWRRDVTCYVFEGGLGRALVSSSGLDVSNLISPSRESIMIKSPDLDVPKLKVLRLQPAYRTLALPPNASPTAIAFDGTDLWIALRYYDSGSYSDSMLVQDVAGERLQTLPIDQYVVGMTWSPHGLWTISLSRPITYRLHDSNLSPIGEFSLEEYFDRYAANIAWANGRIWLLDRYVNRLVAIDPDASIALGAAVISDSVALDSDTYYSGPMIWNGDAMCIAFAMDSIRSYDLSGHQQFAVPNPFRIGYPGCLMAWDGEAIWTIHNGIGRAVTDKRVLSRLYLR